MPLNIVILSSSDEDENGTNKSRSSLEKLIGLNMDSDTTDDEGVVFEKKRKLTCVSNVPPAKKVKLCMPSTSEKNPESDKDNSTTVDLAEMPAEVSAQASTSHLAKPTLIVTKKQPIKSTNNAEELFAMFLSQCLKRERSADMEKIVEKLKRHFEQMDPDFAASQRFSDLLNEKRECLMREEGLLFTHICDVKEEMKLGKKGKKHPSLRESFVMKNEPAEEQNPEDSAEMIRHNRKIEQLQTAMEKCQKRIQQLEEAEVDFDEEDDSSYLKVHRYKERAVEIYAKWCELTGNFPDAGRPYLRPKCYQLTGISTVDQAINSFINSKLSKSKKRKVLKQSAAESMVFPDYQDIYKLIHTYNVNNNLGLDNQTEISSAKRAFTKLGGLLKSERQRDFFDSFSLLYENSKDPALNDLELDYQLKENRAAGEQKLNSIFEEYCQKQEELKKSGSINSSESEIYSDKESEDEEENEEEIVLSDSSDTEIDEINSSESTEKASDDPDIKIEDNKSENNKTDDGLMKNKSNERDNKISEQVDLKKSLSDVKKKSVDRKDSGIIEDVSSPSGNQNKKTEIVEIIIEDNVNSAKVPKIVSENIPPLNSAPKQNNSSDKDSEKNNSKDLIIVDEPSDVITKPLLKLKSFAKPSEFWENSQDVDKSHLDDKNQELIEIIEVDTVTTNETTKKKPPPALCSKLKPVTSKKFVILKNIKTVSASKFDKKRVTRPAMKPVSSLQHLVPLSSMEIRRGQASRPVAHIVGQRTNNTIVDYLTKQKKQPVQAVGKNAPAEIQKKTATAKQ